MHILNMQTIKQSHALSLSHTQLTANSTITFTNSVLVFVRQREACVDYHPICPYVHACLLAPPLTGKRTRHGCHWRRALSTARQVARLLPARIYPVGLGGSVQPAYGGSFV